MGLPHPDSLCTSLPLSHLSVSVNQVDSDGLHILSTSSLSFFPLSPCFYVPKEKWWERERDMYKIKWRGPLAGAVGGCVGPLCFLARSHLRLCESERNGERQKSHPQPPTLHLLLHPLCLQILDSARKLCLLVWSHTTPPGIEWHAVCVCVCVCVCWLLCVCVCVC